MPRPNRRRRAAWTGIRGRTWRPPLSSPAPRRSVLLAEIWGAQLGIDSRRHSRPVLRPGRTLVAGRADCIGDLRPVPDRAAGAQAVPGADGRRTRGAGGPGSRLRARLAEPAACSLRPPAPKPCTELQGNAPEVAAKASYREFYNDVTRRLEQSGMGAASFFLNYGYVSLGDGDEARFEVPAEVFNRNSVRLAFELIGATQLNGRNGAGRRLRAGRNGGAARRDVRRRRRRAWIFRPRPSRSAGARTGMRTRFEVGDAEHLPFEDEQLRRGDNMESSHTYPNLRAFFARGAPGAGQGRQSSSTPTCCRFSDGRRCACCSTSLGLQRRERTGHHRQRARVMR